MEGINTDNNKTLERLVDKNEDIKNVIIPDIAKSPEEQISSISNEINKEENTIISTKNSIDKIRQELGLVGEETNIPSIEFNKNKKSKLEKALSLISSNVSGFTKVAAVSAGLFAGGNNLEANNIEQNQGDKFVQGMENVSSIEDDKGKIINGGNLEEVVVYGKKKYEEELFKQEANIKKFEAEMAKYQKDSAEWAKANEAYKDSLNAFNSMKEVDLLTDKYGTSDPWNKSLRKAQDRNSRLVHMENKIDPVSYRRNMNLKVPNPNAPDTSPNKYSIGWLVNEYKKPTNEPIPPQKPENPANKEIKYDPKFEDLNMRSLWATILKQDPNAKIGTLHLLDPQFKEGFTLEEAMTFPQEIKDRYNIDYIYNQIHSKDESSGGDYKHPGWDYNNPEK